MRSKGGLAGLLLFIPFFSCSARALALASHARMDISVALTGTYQRLSSGIVNYCPRPETFSGAFGLFEWNKRFQPMWFRWKKKKWIRRCKKKLYIFCIFVLSSGFSLEGGSIREWTYNDLIIFINYRTMDFCIWLNDCEKNSVKNFWLISNFKL